MTQTRYYWHAGQPAPYVAKWKGWPYPGSKTNSELGGLGGAGSSSDPRRHIPGNRSSLGDIVDVKLFGIPASTLALVGIAGYAYYKYIHKKGAR